MSNYEIKKINQKKKECQPPLSFQIHDQGN